MNPTQSQLDGDLYYFATCKSKKASPVGTQCRILHDKESRWFRIWRRIDQGWRFVGMQQGQNPIQEIVEIKMIESNWRSSGRPQDKPKRKPKALQQWIAAHKLLVARLREGINQEDPRGSFFFGWIYPVDSALRIVELLLFSTIE